MLFRPVMAFTLFALVMTCQVANAQDQPTDDAMAAFNKVYAQWQDVNKQTEALMTEARSADRSDPAAMNKLRERFMGLQKQGKDLLPQLRATGLAAYRVATDPSKDLTSSLISIAGSEALNDQYGKASEITNLMMQKGYAGPELFDVSGVIAFGMDDFDKAEAMFKQAADKGGLQMGARYQGMLADLKANWAEETKIRAAEAKADDLPRVMFETSSGPITIELFENQAPNSVANFISLIESGYYDGLNFHRVLGNFMAQGGCPDGTGAGGPGYKIPCECDVDNYRHHFSGTLSMAHAGKDTGGSQFFLTFMPTPFLDGKHTAFGRVIEGKDVLGELTKVDPSRPMGVSPSTITKATVVRKRDHDYTPKKVGE